MLYRVWNIWRRPQVQTWENKAAATFDKARAGSSAFKAAAVRAMELEVAQASGKCAAALLWDVLKYFDSVNIQLLAE